jgi:hypothetical protein
MVSDRGGGGLPPPPFFDFLALCPGGHAHWSLGFWLLCQQRRWYASFLASLENGDWWEARCALCGWWARTPHKEPLQRHMASCSETNWKDLLDSATSELPPVAPHEDEGRGENWLSNGDVESNPGPAGEPASGNNGPNPTSGPKQSGQPTRRGEDFMLDTSSSTTW